VVVDVLFEQGRVDAVDRLQEFAVLRAAVAAAAMTRVTSGANAGVSAAASGVFSSCGSVRRAQRAREGRGRGAQTRRRTLKSMNVGREERAYFSRASMSSAHTCRFEVVGWAMGCGGRRTRGLVERRRLDSSGERVASGQESAASARRAPRGI
jgi:hypothetical protein